MPRSARAHAEEVCRRREAVTPEQLQMRAYSRDSPNWCVLDHEEERRRVALAAYQATFGWAGPAPVFIDLIGGDGDVKGKGKADDV
ncbi:Phosphoinositide phospholipase C 6 [Hordeum vulgare]|nr:Phosphoinositide phospholipase C 6 [Hordeum vulgare]